MPFLLKKSYPRLWSLDAGIAMVVTDLHGDWEAYTRHRDRFIDLHAAGRADCLIFTGDLIHREPGAGLDRSLGIVLDILALRERYGEAILYLCGNHELPHLYGFVLSRRGIEYTPPFEAALSRSGQRATVAALFDSLPFFIRTVAGVCITHAGASPPMADAGTLVKLLNWRYQDLLAWADEQLANTDISMLRQGYARLSGEDSYDVMARHYLATGGPDDPRYDDLLRGFLISGHPDFSLVRATLFSRCEQEHGVEQYRAQLAAALEQVSIDYVPQRVLVAGHITTPGGHAVIAQRHLRLASAEHARPRQAGQYLLFDTARPIHGADELYAGLRNAIDRDMA